MIKKREDELSKNSYRNQVVGRLKGISKTILDMSIPIAIDVSLEKVCKIIQKKLHTFYKDTIINSLITLGLNITGILLVHFVPFGKTFAQIELSKKNKVSHRAMAMHSLIKKLSKVFENDK